jgi:hypothetical protein
MPEDFGQFVTSSRLVAPFFGPENDTVLNFEQLLLLRTRLHSEKIPSKTYEPLGSEWNQRTLAHVNREYLLKQPRLPFQGPERTRPQPRALVHQ